MESTPRQKQVLQLIMKAKTNQDIADELGISLHTVKMHVKNLFTTRNVSSRAQLMLKEYRRQQRNVT